MKNQGVALGAVFVALQVATATPGQAQTADNQQARENAPPSSGDPVLGGDIVVTATKRGENVQSVGISITALSGDQLSALGVKNSSDLSLYTPGLQLQSAGGESNTMALTLRGVGQSDFNDHQEGPVAIYVDDVYSSALTGTSFLAFDLDRVEVLRGPQGTLFGRNATGGLVQFVTRRPTNHLDGYIDVGYGRFNEITAEGAVGGPIAENLQARISLATEQRDKYFKNSIAGVPGGNGKDSFAGRLQLAWQPTEALNLRISAHGADSRNSGPRGRHISTNVDPATGLANQVPANVDFYGTGPGNDLSGYENRNANYWSGAFNQANPLTVKTWGISGYADADLGAVKLFSVTDYSNFKHRYREDSDLGPNSGLRFAVGSEIRQFSQELRLQYDSDKLKALVGAYYLNIDGTFQNEFLIYRAFSNPLGLGPDGLGALLPWTTKTRSYSFFGQLDYRLTDTLTATGGVRWTSDVKRQKLDSYAVSLANDPERLTLADVTPADSLLSQTYRNRRSDKFVSWKLGLDWKPQSNTLIFLSATRGQKGGGYNVPFFAGDSQTSVLTFRPEQLTSYEGGLKLSGTGLVRRFNASVYHYDYKDFQAFQVISAAGLVFNTNAKVTGAELELVLQPFRGLTAQVGGAFVFDAKANDISLPNGSIKDRRLAQTPDAQLTGVLRYDFAVGASTMTAQLDGRYVSSQFYDVINNPVTTEGAYGLLNARLFFKPGGKDVTISAFVENLTNTKYRSYAVDLGLSLAQQWLGQPRTYGVKFAYKFGG